MNELENILNALTHRELVVVIRQFKGGPVGYDFQKKDKAFLLSDAKEKALHYASSKYPGKGYSGSIADVKRWLGDDRKVGGGDHEGKGDGDKPKSGARPPAGDGNMLGKGQGKADGEGQGQGKPQQGEGEGGGNALENAIDKRIEHHKKVKSVADGKTAVSKEHTDATYVRKDEAKPLIEGEVERQLEKRERVFRLTIQKPDGTTYEAGEAPRHKVFPEVLSAVSAGLNVLLVGPAGCGKTHMSEQVAQALKLDFRFTGAVASEYKLLGFVDAQGRTIVTEYRRAYQEGGVFLWDEMDASAPQALLAFNAGLSNGWQDFPDGVVKVNENFRAIASANTYGSGADRMYVGRNQLDAASLDRFYVVSMDYDQELEQVLYGTHNWVKYVWKARKIVQEMKIRHVVSMRAIDAGLRAIKAGIDRKKFEHAVLWKHMDPLDLKKVQEKMGTMDV